MRICPKCRKTLSDDYRFCSTCGVETVIETKSSGTSGNNPPVPAKTKKLPTVLAVLFAATALLLGAALISVQNEYDATCDRLRDRISNLESKVSKYEDKAEFLDSHVVIRSESDPTHYHKYGCPDLDLSSFWAYNTEAVPDKCTPCPKCIQN